MRIKPSEALRFLGALLAGAVLLVLVVLRVTSCAPLPPPGPPVTLPLPPPVAAPAGVPSAAAPTPPGVAGGATSAGCRAEGWSRAAQANARQLRSLAWAPFGRPEVGWETYYPLIAREVGTACPPDSEGFASALAAWQGDQRLLPTGTVNERDFIRMKGVIQTRRPFVQLSARGVCPNPPPESNLEWNRTGEGYGGKRVQLRPEVFAAYRSMVAAARTEAPEVAADPRNFTIFSAYRSPDYDAARCARDGNCNGIVRARCSPHRTGLAIDLYVGQAPGYGPDSSADPNRLFMTGTPAYRWLVRNADRFGFASYPFEPWHWEWVGAAP